MDNFKKLHTSLFGYKKSQVHGYLADFSTSAQAEVEKYKNEAKEASQRLEELKKDAAQKKREFDEAIKAQKEEAEKIKTEKEKEISELLEKIKEFEAIKEDLAAEAKLLEEKKNIISSTLIDARRNADSIVAEAQSHADEILNKLQEQCDEKRQLLKIDLDNIKREIEQAKGNVYAIKSDVIKAMERHEQQLKSYREELECIVAESEIGGLK